MYPVYYIFYYHFEIYVYLFKKQGEDGGKWENNINWWWERQGDTKEEGDGRDIGY